MFAAALFTIAKMGKPRGCWAPGPRNGQCVMHTHSYRNAAQQPQRMKSCSVTTRMDPEDTVRTEINQRKTRAVGFQLHVASQKQNHRTESRTQGTNRGLQRGGGGAIASQVRGIRRYRLSVTRVRRVQGGPESITIYLSDDRW